MILQGIPQKIRFLLVDEDMNPMTGVTPSVELCLPSDRQFEPYDGPVRELGGGWYQIVLMIDEDAEPGQMLCCASAPGSQEWRDRLDLVKSGTVTAKVVGKIEVPAGAMLSNITGWRTIDPPPQPVGPVEPGPTEPEPEPPQPEPVDPEPEPEEPTEPDVETDTNLLGNEWRHSTNKNAQADYGWSATGDTIVVDVRSVPSYIQVFQGGVQFAPRMRIRFQASGPGVVSISGIQHGSPYGKRFQVPPIELSADMAEYEFDIESVAETNGRLRIWINRDAQPGIYRFENIELTEVHDE